MVGKVYSEDPSIRRRLRSLIVIWLQNIQRKDFMSQLFEVRVYGKNRKKPPDGGRSYWSDIESWKSRRFKEVGQYPVTVNVTSRSANWGESLSPMFLGPVKTYMEGSTMRSAVNVEVVWQYSKVYTQEKVGKELRPLWFTGKDGNPNERWFEWRNKAWSNPEFSYTHGKFAENKSKIRRAFPKGSKVGYWFWEGRKLDQVSARREIYGRIYSQEVKKTDAFQKLQEILTQSDLLIYDIDGYDYLELGMTPEDTIRDLNHSWGHGLVLSFLLNGIDPVTLGGANHG